MRKVIKNKTNILLIIGILLSIGICNVSLAAGSSMSILPEVISEESLGYVFTIDVDVNPVGSEIFGAQYELYYNKNVLKATAQEKGILLTRDGVNSFIPINSINNDNGKIHYGESRIGDPDIIGGITDPGVLASITFEVIGTGASNLVLEAMLSDPFAWPIDVETNNGLYGELDNGYKGDKPLTTYRHDTTTGDLYFSHGDSYYSGKLWNDDIDPYTVSHQVTLPSGASVEFARLYNYWTWSACGTTGQYPTMTLTFEGNTISTDDEYDDRKGWGSVYDYPAGTWAYDVTSHITGSGVYTTTVRNTDSDSDSYVCMDGIGLLIVYSDPGGQQIEYWINEGADILSTMDTSGGVTAEEATTTSMFSGSVDPGIVESARLWTVVQAGGNEHNKLIFNAADWTGVYDAIPYSDLDIDEARDVTSHLVGNHNIVKIQAAPVSTGGDYLMPSNAFLVLNVGGTPPLALSISADPTTVTVGTPTDVTFTVTNGSALIEGASITLTGCADESGTTDASGIVVISVNATSAGTITAIASKDGYTNADTSLTAEEQGEGTSSLVSLSVNIKPAISFVVTPNSIDFGELSPGETSDVQSLTLENKGGSGFTVTAQVSDNLAQDSLFKNGFLLDSVAWGDYTTSIGAQASDITNASLSVPGDYTEVGQKQGEIVFWVKAENP